MSYCKNCVLDDLLSAIANWDFWANSICVPLTSVIMLTSCTRLNHGWLYLQVQFFACSHLFWFFMGWLHDWSHALCDDCAMLLNTFLIFVVIYLQFHGCICFWTVDLSVIYFHAGIVEYHVWNKKSPLANLYSPKKKKQNKYFYIKEYHFFSLHLHLFLFK